MYRHWDISSCERFELLRTYTNYGLEHWGSDFQVRVPMCACVLGEGGVHAHVCVCISSPSPNTHAHMGMNPLSLTKYTRTHGHEPGGSCPCVRVYKVREGFIPMCVCVR